jgi:hypothetical protein
MQPECCRFIVAPGESIAQAVSIFRATAQGCPAEYGETVDI